MTRRSIFALLASLALTSCGEVDPTEVVVVVTGDFAVPADLDRVIIEVTPPSGTPQTAEADLTEQGLPRSLDLFNPDGPLGPYRVEAVGMSGGVAVVRRRAIFEFRRDESLEIEVPLLVECAGVSCSCTAVTCSTCGEGGTCGSAFVDPQPFDGVSRHLEGSVDLDL